LFFIWTFYQFIYKNDKRVFQERAVWQRYAGLIRCNHSFPQKTMRHKKNPIPETAPRQLATLWPAGLAVIALVAVGVIVYANTLHSPFVFDDINFITKNNPSVHMKTLSWENLKKAAFEAQPRHRIPPKLSFALNYYFGEENPFGYHLINLAIHLLTGIFLFLFFFMTLSMPQAAVVSANANSPRGDPTAGLLISFFAALIWLVHPVQTSAVTYMCQRMAGMTAMFYVLAILLYGKARICLNAHKKRHAGLLFAGCAIAGLCAVASKENAGTLPLFILLYEWFFFQNLRDFRSFRALPWVIAGILVFTGIGLIFLGDSPIHRILASYTRREFTLSERVLTELRVVAYYVSLLGFPHPERLILDHDYPLSHSMFNPATTFTAFLLILSLFGVALYSAKKRRLFSFCLLWFLGNLVIESSVIGIEIIYEHRLYLPSMMIFLLVLVWLFKTLKTKPAAAILTATAILLSVWAHQRNEIWRSDISFWTDCSAKSPAKARPYQNLAYSFQMAGRFAEAIPNYQKSIEIKPHPVAYYNLGLALAREKNYMEAAEAYVNAIKTGYNTTQVQSSLGQALVHMGELETALIHLGQAAAATPPDPAARQKIFEIENFLKNCGGPISCVQRLISLEPDNPALFYKLGVLHEKQGTLEQAASAYEAVLAKTDKSTERLYLMGLNRLATVYTQRGEIRRALELFRKGIQRAPDQPYLHFRIAHLYARQQDRQKAKDWLEKAIQRGFCDFKQIESDQAWEWLKQTPYYQDLKKRF
jgi:protein O-mannosyl-transferase